MNSHFLVNNLVIRQSMLVLKTVAVNRFLIIYFFFFSNQLYITYKLLIHVLKYVIQSWIYKSAVKTERERKCKS
jgi:hypothetical protein